MKFFTATLAALVAAGSALAAPMNAAEPRGLLSPITTKDIPTRSPGGSWTGTWAPSGPGSASAPVIIAVNAAIDVVAEVEALIKADLEIIAGLVVKVNVDAQLLLKAIISLKGHLQQFQQAGDCLKGTTAPNTGLTAAELEIVLYLVVRVEALVADVQLCLKNLVVSVKADVLAVIGVELKIVLGLIAPIVAPIVKIALSLVVGLEVTLSVLVTKITLAVGHINSCVSGITVLINLPILSVFIGIL
ncbi:hypothetical protein B0H66DRAFT_532399 [Apodospora peruviana]|uniref:Uncharacterized protein n=1 Tax=Apodospora peruviana TaxID=516989 RepID=A0AAE0IDR0_9PEZI|nr:hypothetical protein B0H66DRAFT_532399 [Apodospora peruviana]